MGGEPHTSGTSLSELSRYHPARRDRARSRHRSEFVHDSRNRQVAFSFSNLFKLFTLVRRYFIIRRSGRRPIRVVRVVVVAAAVGVDIPKIRGIRDIRRTRPPVAGEDLRKQPVFI